MNKKALVLSLVFLGFLLSGCGISRTIRPTSLANTAPIQDFEFVVLNTPGVMEISRGATESLEMIGDPSVISTITASVADRTLLISSEKDLPVNSSISYKLFVKNLSGVVLNGFSVVKIPAFTSDALDLTVNGSGRMDLGDIKVANLQFIINGNGSVEAISVNSTRLNISSPETGGVRIGSGSTEDLALELGSGSFLGADFKSTNVILDMNGSGTAQVWAVEKLDVTINGNGIVTYFGEPTLSMSISGGGQLSGGGNK